METKKTQLKRIDAVYFRLSRILGSSRDGDRYFDLCEAEEREHRRFMGASRRGITVSQAARLSYAKQVLQYRAGKLAPDAADYFHIRGSIFGAWALYAEFRQRIDAEFTQDEAERFCEEIEYHTLVE